MKNVAGHLVAWSFLMTILLPMAAMSQSLNSTLDKNPGKITLQPYEIFNRSAIGGASSIFPFVNEETEKKTGICNVEKGRLPKNQLFIFNQVAVGYKLDAENKAGNVDYNGTIPPALRNAEFEITQNGRKVLDLPMASLYARGTAQSASEQYATLGSFFYLEDDLDFEWTIKFATGATIAADTATDTNYFEVRLKGHRTISKAI